MARARAILVVGHENWGKSRTLQALTGGQQRSAMFGSTRVYVKRMSNDDDPLQLEKYFRDLNPAVQTRVLVAFCPKLAPPDTSARNLLAILQPGYDLLFWVQRDSYPDQRVISPAELAAMRACGRVHVFPGRAADVQRGADLRRFILANS